ncbi:hypothetical protein KSC_105420 [Ktedonobacter sp. SOSP1-52]|nr:hypothetical protein KSC_105420 [Ktedonobacter sp. SOSP1-52]
MTFFAMMRITGIIGTCVTDGGKFSPIFDRQLIVIVHHQRRFLPLLRSMCPRQGGNDANKDPIGIGIDFLYRDTIAANRLRLIDLGKLVVL